MAIVDVFQPDVYFGRPGALVTLPWPRGDLGKPAEPTVSDFTTGSGAHRVTRLLRVPRTYNLQWNALRYDTFARIEAYHLGHNGIGPWAYIDPSAINLLTVNQASATGDRNAVQGFSTFAANHGAVSSNDDPEFIHRAGGQRSVRWLWATAPFASPRLDLDAVWSRWFGVPCVIGKSYTWSAWVKPDGVVDASISVQAKIQWRGPTGAIVGVEPTGGLQVATGWTKLVCTGVAPAGAAFCSPRLVADGTTITTGGSLYVDEMQLEMDTVATDWRPGNGVYPVSILGLSEVVPFAATWRTGPQLVLREIG